MREFAFVDRDGTGIASARRYRRTTTIHFDSPAGARNPPKSDHFQDYDGQTQSAIDRLLWVQGI
jgi:hypothetical protein